MSLQKQFVECHIKRPSTKYFNQELVIGNYYIKTLESLSFLQTSHVKFFMLGTYTDTYWTNSQYRVDLSLTAEERTTSGKCAMVVSLMQKNTQRNRTRYHVQSTEIPMSFALYKVSWHVLSTFHSKSVCLTIIAEEYIHYYSNKKQIVLCSNMRCFSYKANTVFTVNVA